MGFLDIESIRGGIRLTLTAADRTASVSTDRSPREAEQLVRQICAVAGLPEPWKKG